ncbi:unnamed protein product [Didymodactylos carnosus]|uniref:Uncharacterized protein n=1 Tax=Didymodactylos carnosus TaxID=1234261 RepID=A0A815YL97_9BILA|nr:unnamed protein product [Didymodactylos carnosus]CAF4435004.1 unnamed protein product [Didymodactylos carnosus]
MAESLKKNEIYKLEGLSSFIRTNLKRSTAKTIDYIGATSSEAEFSSDDDENEQYKRDEDDSVGVDDEEEEFVDDEQQQRSEDENNNTATTTISKTKRNTFCGMRVVDSIKPEKIDSYFRIEINGALKYIHKQTAAWFLMDNKTKLSSDQLQRVQETGQESQK